VKVEPIAYFSKRYSTSFKPSTRIIPNGSERTLFSNTIKVKLIPSPKTPLALMTS
jgi:hypothetical protein